MISLQSLRTDLEFTFLEGGTVVRRGAGKSRSEPYAKYFEFFRIYNNSKEKREARISFDYKEVYHSSSNQNDYHDGDYNTNIFLFGLLLFLVSSH